MAQLNFEYNYPSLGGLDNRGFASNGTILFFGFNIRDSISWATINFLASLSAGTRTVSFGLYSLNGSTLSLANSASVSFTGTNARYISITDISTAQNITPGTWYFGFLLSTAVSNNFTLYAQTLNWTGNAFPGSFIGGRMTVTTSALPTSYATSDLSTQGVEELMEPLILLTA